MRFKNGSSILPFSRYTTKTAHDISLSWAYVSMWQKRYQTSCVDKIWSRKNFLTNGNVNHLVQIRSVAIGASTQDSPMTWFDRSRMLSYESANLLKELLRQDDCTRAECVIRNIAYYLQSLEKANYAPNRTISTCEWDRLWYRLAYRMFLPEHLEL